MLEKKDILVLLPAYNEATHIVNLCNEISTLGYPNICVVNDGSTDNTAQLKFENEVIMIHHVINRGVGAATDTGLRYARLKKYKAVITIDADAQHLPSDIDILYNTFNESNADIIIGSRFLKIENHIPFIRKIYNLIANLFTRIYLKTYISDTQSGIKLIGEHALKVLFLETDGYEFCSEIIIKSAVNNLKIVEVPVSVFYTEYSMSKGQGIFMGIKTVFNLFANLLVNDKE